MSNLSVAEVTKQNIIEAFWRLYCIGGISNVSVTKICKLAGYNRSTFYKYFQDIYAVLETIESNLISAEAFKTELLFPLIHTPNSNELLKQVIHFFDTYSPYLPILLSENGDPHFRHKLLERFIPVISEVIPSTKQYSPKQLAYIIEYQNAAVISTVTKWYQNKKDIPEEDLISLLLQLTNHGTRNILFNPLFNLLS